MQAEHPEAPCDETNDTTILTGKYVFQSIEFLWLEESNKQTFSFTCHTQVYLLRFGIAIAAFVPAANVNQVRLVSVPYSLRKTSIAWGMPSSLIRYAPRFKNLIQHFQLYWVDDNLTQARDPRAFEGNFENKCF